MLYDRSTMLYIAYDTSNKQMETNILIGGANCGGANNTICTKQFRLALIPPILPVLFQFLIYRLALPKKAEDAAPCPDKNFVQFASIKPRKMFYNPVESGEVHRLISLLSEENYRKVQGRLNERGMNKGFACLFSGGPGTGKTETAYQIARETKRDIMMVNIAGIKSCWVGEAEREIKEVFDNYREAVNNSEMAPILLFNEADAVILSEKNWMPEAGRRISPITQSRILFCRRWKIFPAS